MTHQLDMSLNREQMEPYMKATHTKRFVVEDSITKVTSDGQPHEMMTMVAGLSGLVAAMVILAVLISLVSCKRGKKAQHCKNCPRIVKANGVAARNFNLNENSARAISLEVGNSLPSTPKYDPSVSFISTAGNLSGNLNSAFIESELTLTGSLTKTKKKTHWSDDMNAEGRVKETSVDIERF